METESQPGIGIKEQEVTPSRRLLIFGQGPVIDQDLRSKAQDANTIPGNEDMNLWGHTLADAGAVLFQRGVVSELIIMGGRTGGTPISGEYASESELLARKLEALGVPSTAITEEKRSTNTLENLVNLLEEVITTDSSQGELDILGTTYHLPRLRLLMELFAIPYTHAFSADEVLRTVAYEEEGPTSEKVSEIEKRLAINEAGRIPVSSHDEGIKVGYFDNKIGTERKNILRRFQEEDVFTRSLLETPEYWITYVGRIKDINRLQKVLDNVSILFPSLLTQYGISTEAIATEDEYQSIREKLLAIPRKLPNLDEMIAEQQSKGWPESTTKLLDQIVEKRTSHS